MIDITKLKSAEVVSEPSKIEEALTKSHEEFAKANATNPIALSSTRLVRNSEDRLVVTKRTASTAGLVATAGFKMPGATQLGEMAKGLGIKWDETLAERVKAYWASDERVDRHGDILEQSWVFKDYGTNPLFLYGHGWDMPPIGSSLKWEVVKRKEGGYDGDALRLLCLFATKEQWDFADTIFRLADGGFLRTGSVGCYPGDVVYVKDPEERNKLGLGPYGCILRKPSLVEFSAVSVPANPGAHLILNGLKAKGLVKPGDLQVLRELMRREFEPSGDVKTWRSADAGLLVAFQSMFHGLKVPEHKELDSPFLLEAIHEEATRTHAPKKDDDSDNDKQVEEVSEEAAFGSTPDGKQLDLKTLTKNVKGVKVELAQAEDANVLTGDTEKYDEFGVALEAIGYEHSWTGKAEKRQADLYVRGSIALRTERDGEEKVFYLTGFDQSSVKADSEPSGLARILTAGVELNPKAVELAMKLAKAGATTEEALTFTAKGPDEQYLALNSLKSGSPKMWRVVSEDGTTLGLDELAKAHDEAKKIGASKVVEAIQRIAGAVKESTPRTLDAMHEVLNKLVEVQTEQGQAIADIREMLESGQSEGGDGKAGVKGRLAHQNGVSALAHILQAADE